jgi:hypothetical protein
MHSPTDTELGDNRVLIVSWSKDHFKVRSGKYIIWYHKEKTNGLILISNERNEE